MNTDSKPFSKRIFHLVSGSIVQSRTCKIVANDFRRKKNICSFKHYSYLIDEILQLRKRDSLVSNISHYCHAGSDYYFIIANHPKNADLLIQINNMIGLCCDLHVSRANDSLFYPELLLMVESFKH